jgi:hypothetical protein
LNFFGCYTAFDVHQGNEFMSIRAVILFVASVLYGCGEVKVVDDDSSSILRVNPMSEIVEVETNVAGVSRLECLRLIEPSFQADNSATDLSVFSKAIRAHLAPLNYQVNSDCPHSFGLNVLEYGVQEILIASRVVVDLEGEIRDGSGTTLWKASYRFTENAGSIPFDPISMGLAAVFAAKNSSEDSQHNAIYLAVRRLLKALPENSTFSSGFLNAKSLLDTNTVNSNGIDESLKLWASGEKREALRIAESAYQTQDKADLGYQYGLMLEASGEDERAAEVYSDTAIIQLQQEKFDLALRTLRRLDRLNETSSGQFNLQLTKALEFVKQQ